MHLSIEKPRSTILWKIPGVGSAIVVMAEALWEGESGVKLDSSKSLVRLELSTLVKQTYSGSNFG